MTFTKINGRKLSRAEFLKRDMPDELIKLADGMADDDVLLKSNHKDLTYGLYLSLLDQNWPESEHIIADSIWWGLYQDTLGQRVKRARRAKGLTLTGLGKLANIKMAQISQIESGVSKNPTAKTLMALSLALEVSVDWLLFDERIHSS